MRRVLSALVLAFCLSGVATSQPPPPFSISITSPGIFAFASLPVTVQGISGAPNSTITVKLYDNNFNVVATKVVGTDAMGSWAANFGLVPSGQYVAEAKLLTGQGTATVFFVSNPNP